MKILFGVFDWGLGHATRDIPLITRLLDDGHSVDIISTGRSLRILRLHFKQRCKYFDVPSVASPYTKTPFFTFRFISLMPKMLRSLEEARAISQLIIKKGGYDKVISDCRYDVYDSEENSYLINHQLRFKSYKVPELINELWLAERMKRYKYVIVPDFKKRNISGNLSHNLRFFPSARIRYIGILSHIKRKSLKKDIDYFISLSGPEPQRTVLEEKILAQLDQLKGKVVIAAGNPEGANKQRRMPINVTFYDHAQTKMQEELLNRAKFVITRSGYTTIMELCELGVKNALLIPTPGQTEQEYLADYYEERGYFHHVSQLRLKLGRDVAESKDFKGFRPSWLTEQTVDNFMGVVFRD